MQATPDGRSVEVGRTEASSPRGRPAEDRLQRQREIYEAAGPLILARGPRKLSMQEIARATHVSVGSLYYYFPSKHELVVCGLRTDVLAHRCEAFHRATDHLRRSDPRAYLSAFVENSVDGMLFIRPAVYAASELGSAVLWPSLEAALAANTREFQDALSGVLSASEARLPGLARFGRIWRRFFFGAVLDWQAPRRELEDGVLAMIRGLTPPGLVLHTGGLASAGRYAVGQEPTSPAEWARPLSARARSGA